MAVLITGASGGIGLELANVFAQHGHHLLLVARNKQKLDELGERLAHQWGISVRTIQKDLSVDDSAQEVYAAVTAESLPVDILVNNAGFATFGYFVEIEPRDELEELHVNIVTLTHLTKLFLKDMVTRGRGRILNVASTAAFQPGPLMSVYYASKAFVLFFSEALANEVKGTGVSVSVLCPGPTKTGFQGRAAMEDSRLVAGRRLMDARTVAEHGYRGLMSGKAIIIPGLLNKLGAQGYRFLPRRAIVTTMREIQKRKE
jgi:uncharacterized protein